MSSEELEVYLEKEGVLVKFHHFAEHTMTVAAAVKQLGVSPNQIIKSMLFIDNERQPVLAIVPGDRRVSSKKLASVCQAQSVRKANPAEVKEFTGYVVGAIPPVGHKQQLRTFIDGQSMEFPSVIGGGGTINVLLEINPIDIQRLTKATVWDISY